MLCLLVPSLRSKPQRPLCAPSESTETDTLSTYVCSRGGGKNYYVKNTVYILVSKLQVFFFLFFFFFNFCLFNLAYIVRQHPAGILKTPETRAY